VVVRSGIDIRRRYGERTLMLSEEMELKGSRERAVAARGNISGRPGKERKLSGSANRLSFIWVVD
jgi:hypothetical protein